ncbi:PilT domain-containing protein [Candidatus Vecturithrix granuli]|uniref:Ribonuclease VapC n=1 Tax=Vecturithrix granuli TaxID=1499967 RepID=A0A081CAL4_VECG1|nr:PilT domain-containing protein [Candidatus Vecturithrix granuli]
MRVKYFLDTNVLVYAFDQNEPEKRDAAKQYLQRLFTDEEYVLSVQVLNEFCNVAQKKLDPPMPQEKLQAFIRLIPDERLVPLTKEITEHAIAIQHANRLSFWDSVIVATAMEGDCQYILTKNLSHSQKIGDVTIMNPFLHD